MAEEINFVRPQEVYDVANEESIMRYKGYDGNWHYVKTSDRNTSHPNWVNNLEELFNPIPYNGDTFEKSYPTKKPDHTLLTYSYDEPDTDVVTTDAQNPTITLDNNTFLVVGDTLLIQGTYGYDEDGENPTSQELVVYVTDIDEGGHNIKVKPYNGKKIGNVANCLPSVMRGAIVIRAGEATTEGDELPDAVVAHIVVDAPMQRFASKLVEEHSLVDGEIVANTPLNDEESICLADMVAGRDFSYLNGVKGNNSSLPLAFDGIWNLAENEFAYGEDENGNYTIDINALAEAIIESNYLKHSATKLILCGTRLYKMLCNKYGESVETPFCKFEFIYFPTMDMSDSYQGLVIDPAYLKIYAKTPLRGDFTQGEGGEDSYLTFLEESTIVVEQPKALCRIVAM